MPHPLATWNQEQDFWEEGQDIFGLSVAYSGTLPPSGMTRAGQLFALPTWEPPHHRARVFLVAYPADTGRVGLQASRRGSGSVAALTGPVGGAGALPDGLSHLPTPNASDGTGGGQTPDKRTGRSRQLIDAVLDLGGQPYLPTPVAQPSGNTPDDHLRKKPGRKVVTDLAVLVENDLLRTGGKLEHLPTPRASDPANASSHASDGFRPPLGEVVRDESVFGKYEPVVHRWEAVTGMPAPAPTELNKNGRPRLNAAFAEFMMGLPPGWVPQVPGVTRSQQLKAIGNGVCPQQAAAALRHLLEEA